MTTEETVVLENKDKVDGATREQAMRQIDALVGDLDLFEGSNL